MSSSMFVYVDIDPQMYILGTFIENKGNYIIYLYRTLA